MSTTPRKMLTIVVESVLERAVVEALQRARVSGFTTVEARGFGEHGLRQGDWDESRSVRIETICTPETAAKLAHGLLDRFGKDYALVLWLQDVEVVRAGKFEAAADDG